MSRRPNDNRIFFPLGDSVCAGTTTRANGVSYALHTSESEEEYRAAVGSRLDLSQETGFGPLVTLRQTHSDIVTCIDSHNLQSHLADPLIEGDGLYTNLSGILIGVLTADCLPLFFTDQTGGFAGIVHAGRVGVEKGIHRILVESVQRNFGIQAKELIVFAGPHIGACCYEVGPDIAAIWDDEYIDERENRLHLDLAGRVFNELAAAGIPKKAMTGSGMCTRCSENPPFWSYRAGHRRERMLSFIGLRP